MDASQLMQRVGVLVGHHSPLVVSVLGLVCALCCLQGFAGAVLGEWGGGHGAPEIKSPARWRGWVLGWDGSVCGTAHLVLRCREQG